jgi:hypothetical protein
LLERWEERGLMEIGRGREREVGVWGIFSLPLPFSPLFPLKPCPPLPIPKQTPRITTMKMNLKVGARKV